jgi:hypothetical protein
MSNKLQWSLKKIQVKAWFQSVGRDIPWKLKGAIYDQIKIFYTCSDSDKISIFIEFEMRNFFCFVLFFCLFVCLFVILIELTLNIATIALKGILVIIIF